MKVKILVYECGFFIESKVFSSKDIVGISEFFYKYKDAEHLELKMELIHA